MKDTKLFAIFGNPVKHSRSPLMHNKVFKKLGVQACYTRIHLEDGTKLRETFFAQKLMGANITVPHKEAAYKACDEIRGFAQKIGVVNTIVNENGRLIGYNTDADGFLFSIEKFDTLKTILIIGAGGTAKALSMKLQEVGYKVSVLNRSKANLEYFSKSGFITFTWEDCPIVSYDLVVNTTSAGLSDDNYPAPLELLRGLLEKTSYGADAIYGKLTPFLRLCKELNLPYKDGADMLLGQGILANNLFTQEKYSLDEIEKPMKESFSL
ncbi:shikimate dehydrogenase [Sulfurimonas sp. MAG313]|nr:shikimate dehydrogenase [Sulfurimonas sp. MAG313]MDF1881348.1 shikimate dehydrogenase [Sulfurimonas sp. MAG313]